MFQFLFLWLISFCDQIGPNYRTDHYRHAVSYFRSLEITASVLFVYLFIKAYVVVTHLNCIDLSVQFK